MACGVLVISCCSTEPQHIIKNILDTKDLPQPEIHFGSIKSYPWHLETKYYKTNLFLFASDSKDLSPEFADSIEAVVIYFNDQEKDSFDSVTQWLPHLESCEVDVQILACDNCNDDILHDRYLSWCVKHKFEFVELFPESHSDADDEDEYVEATGYKRVIQALQAHLWSNLEMKERKDSWLNFQCHQQSSSTGNDVQNDKDETKKELTQKERIDSLMKTDEEFLQCFGNENSSMSFEDLFQKFGEMKERAANLSGEERKKYAEKVTIAFWNALGGDKEEIAGLSSDED